MTKHLYYEDSYLAEFTADVMEEVRTGGKTGVILDRTAFYPDSGGQPCDTGIIEGVRVESVEEDPSGNILHVLDGPPPTGKVRGTIDWKRRFDHMQQHTGQHILSQAFLATAQANTLSFHLGQQTSTIDLDLPHLDLTLLRAAEELSARVIFEDRPVQVLNVGREQLSSLGVRKESQREGSIRVIDIDRFDRSPCGGTHVRRTGEVGLIFILGGERYKGGVRVEFVCGDRVLREFRCEHEILKELGRIHSAHPKELPGLTEKLLLDRTSLLREKKQLEEQIIALEAQELRSRADKSGGVVAIRQKFDGRRIESMKMLAQKLTAAPGTLAILATMEHGTAQVVVARSADVAGDCGMAIRKVVSLLGGRGGGKPALAQAGGIAAAAVEDWSQALMDYFHTCAHDNGIPTGTDRAHD